MSSYICPRCNYTTNRKSNFKHHITRKNICKPVNTDTTIKRIAHSYGIDISTTEKTHEDTNVYNDDIDTTIQLKKTKGHRMYTCKYCNKSFNSSTSRCRHQRMYCKNKNNSSKEYDYMKREMEKIKEEAKKETERKIKEVEGQIEVLADKKAQKMVLSLVDKLVPNQTTNSHNTNTNTNSHNINTQNNINNIQNNNNNLKINNFGEEKTKYITDDKLKIMFVDPRNVVVQHIKDTYYHVLHPENFNAKITNCKSKHMHIFKENDWEKVNKQLTICSMYNKHEKIIENEFERLKPELTDTVRDNYNEYKKSTLHSFSTFKHRMIDIEAVIINGTKNHKRIDLLSEKEVARLAKEQDKTPGEIFAEHMPDIFGGEDSDFEI